MLIRPYQSKKRNTEKQTKLFSVTEEIKLGKISFRILHIRWYICPIN